MSALSKAHIALYRWRGTAPVAPTPDRSVKAQLNGRVDTIATLKGIRMSQLPKRAQAELRRGPQVVTTGSRRHSYRPHRAH